MKKPPPDVGSRWYPLRPVPEQVALVTERVRFPIVPAGRRSGKTERAKRFVVREALRTPRPFFVAAPTRPQVKKIYWDDIKELAFAHLLPKSAVSETELTIRLPGGGSITLLGLDSPARIEGTPWAGGIIDEIASVKPHAWPEHVRPALDTEDPRYPGYRAWCWLIGVPEGLGHYYDLYQYALHSGDADFKAYTWPSSAVLSEAAIESARRSLSPRQFRQEYEASFETAGGRVYADYGQDNVTTERILPNEPLLWAHDFNYSPMSSAVCVVRGDTLYALDQVVLGGAVSAQSAQEFVERYKGHERKEIELFGDPAGRAGEKHGQLSNYVIMEEILRSSGWKVERRVKKAAPAIRDRQNAVRAKILSAAGARTLRVNALGAPHLHKGLSTLQMKEGSSFIEQDTEYQHITTAIGYLCDVLWPVRPPGKEIDVKRLAIPSINYY